MVSGVVIVTGTLVAYLAVGWQGWWIAPNSELGLYGVGLAAASMLAVTGMIISIDSFGPITDNAGGIAEMANLPAEARAVTDPLDAVGNTTKAITKGYAIGSAVLAALALFAAYIFAGAQDAGISYGAFVSKMTIDNPLIVAGLIIGAILPFFFTSFLMNAVGVAAQAIVFEVRRQFREIPGILEGSGKPEYRKVCGHRDPRGPPTTRRPCRHRRRDSLIGRVYPRADRPRGRPARSDPVGIPARTHDDDRRGCVGQREEIH